MISPLCKKQLFIFTTRVGMVNERQNNHSDAFYKWYRGSLTLTISLCSLAFGTTANYIFTIYTRDYAACEICPIIWFRVKSDTSSDFVYRNFAPIIALKRSSLSQ